MSRDMIAETFDIVPIEDVFDAPEKIEQEKEKPVTNFVEDTDEVKSNIRNVIKKAEDVLDEIIDVAKSSEQPRAYEVAATVMKTLLDANRDLVDISKKKHDILFGKDAKAIESTGSTQINNSNVIMTSAEVLREMLKK